MCTFNLTGFSRPDVFFFLYVGIRFLLPGHRPCTMHRQISADLLHTAGAHMWQHASGETIRETPYKRREIKQSMNGAKGTMCVQLSVLVSVRYLMQQQTC